MCLTNHRRKALGALPVSLSLMVLGLTQKTAATSLESKRRLQRRPKLPADQNRKQRKLLPPNHPSQQVRAKQRQDIGVQMVLLSRDPYESVGGRIWRKTK